MSKLYDHFTDSVPSRKEVELAIEIFEFGFWEANWNRSYYAALRFALFMRKPRIYIGKAGLNLWYPVQVILTMGFVVFVLLWLAAG